MAKGGDHGFGNVALNHQQIEHQERKQGKGESKEISVPKVLADVGLLVYQMPERALFESCEYG